MIWCLLGACRASPVISMLHGRRKLHYVINSETIQPSPCTLNDNSMLTWIVELHVIQFNAYLFMELCEWWRSPIIHIELYNLKWRSINWITELHDWIMEPHKFAFFPSAIHIIQQNINKFYSAKISPHDFDIAFVFNLCLCIYNIRLISKNMLSFSRLNRKIINNKINDTVLKMYCWYHKMHHN